MGAWQNEHCKIGQILNILEFLFEMQYNIFISTSID